MEGHANDKTGIGIFLLHALFLNGCCHVYQRCIMGIGIEYLHEDKRMSSVMIGIA